MGMILTYRARNALMFLAQCPDAQSRLETANEKALEMFEELEDALLIDVVDCGVLLLISINAAGARELGHIIQ